MVVVESAIDDSCSEAIPFSRYKQAALRMTKFLENTSRVFGKKVLLRPIRYDDLTPNAIAVLKEGGAIVLPKRDSSGRRVLVIAKDIAEGIPQIDRVRVGRLWTAVAIAFSIFRRSQLTLRF